MIGNYRSDIMKNVITSVMPDSIAEEVGIEENDILKQAALILGRR